MKLMCSYSNCQGRGLVYFLRKSVMADYYEFVHYDNFRIILGEQSPADLNKDAARCQVFIYQPTPALKYGSLSTEEMCTNVVPLDAFKVSFAYGFNHGFYPLVHHGSWRTSRQVLNLVKACPQELLEAYDQDRLEFDCFNRMIECLNEQRERETAMDVKMADWVLENFKRQQLFICENHPASAYFAELAGRVLKHLEPAWQQELPFASENDAGLPCGMLVAPQVTKELELDYPAQPGAKAYFRKKLQELIKSNLE